ncbi:MAG: Sensor histidine kinase RcsC [Chroococcopsis gigantea SAG 12.99]|jgi:two-component system sensor histidine kinase/response regulator|nr:Sensor histidine kinase RcsC [Chroococcopsis gigantea SAG 12.99]
MNDHPAFVWQKNLSSGIFDQLCSLWQKTVESSPDPAVFICESQFHHLPVSNSSQERYDRYCLLVADDVFALLVGTSTGDAYRTGLSVNRPTIYRFLQHLSSLFPHHGLIQKAFDILGKNSLTSGFGQNRLLLDILAIVTYDSNDRSSLRVSVCQPVEQALSQQLEQERLLNQVISQIRLSLEIPVVLTTAVEEVRKFLDVDRLLIYQFIDDKNSHARGRGRITYEARKSSNVPSLIDQEARDDCFSYIPQYQEKYRQGSIVAVEDVEKNYSYSFCLAEFLRQYQVVSKLIAPIVIQDELWGLLIAHQCYEKRQWQEQEKKFLGHIGEHLSIAIYQAQLYAQVQRQKSVFEQRVIERTQELEDTLIAAEAANLSKSEFLSNMSHELLTPLTCIIGLSSTLQRFSSEKKVLPPEKQQQYLKTIHDNGQKLLSLINDLLSFAQVSTGKAILDIKALSLRKFSNTVIQLLALEAEHKRIRLVLDLQIKLTDDLFYADPERLQQILIHLLRNAIKFTQEYGQVTLRLWRELHEVIFQIEDTGIGIPEQKIPLLFENFKQLETSRRRIYGGVGLGLALTKQLVELHRGIIEVESVLEEGSLFTVRIPDQYQYKNSSLSNGQNGQLSSQLVLGNKTIVLIDNDEENAGIICDLLVAANYQVIWLVDGVSVVKKIEIIQPSLVIIDQQVPEVYAMCQSMKKSSQTKDTRIILLQDAAEITKRNQLTKWGIDDYLLKPIEAEILIEKVRYLQSVFKIREKNPLSSS